MARISSPLGQTIDVAAQTVMSSGGGSGRVIGGGGGGDQGGGRGGAIIVRPQASIVDRNQDFQIQQSQQSIGTLGQSFETIKVQVVDLGNTIKSLSGQLQQESVLEQRNIAQEQETQRRSLERNVRAGQEVTLEQKITNALSKPIATIQSKVTNVFGNIMSALTTVFFGWLTNQGIETLKALTSGNKKKLEEIKWTVLKNVAAAGGIFLAMNIGFGFLLRSITGLTGRVISLTAKIALAPFRALGRGISGIFGGGGGGGRPSGGGGGGRPSGGGVGGLLSKAFTAVGGIGDLMGGQFTDAALAGLTLKGPGIVKPIAGTLYAADAISELFGGNIFGKNPNERQTTSPAPAAAPASTSAAAPTAPAAVPTAAARPTPTPTPAPAAAPIAPSSQAQTPLIPSAFSPSMAISPTSLESAQSSEPTREVAIENSSMFSQVFAQNPETQLQAPVPAAQIQPPPKPQQTVGSLPEQKPNVIIADGGNQTNQMTSPSQQPLTDVPFIPSANPDNFYVLYSQLNYNVVM